MNIVYLAALLLMAVVIVIIAGIALFWSTRHPQNLRSLEKYHATWAIIIAVIFALFVISTLSYMPYPYAHSNVAPNLTVDVQARQFSWCLSPAPNWTACTPNY